ncbi:hypothetical protein ACHAW6_003003 [Cyclotella cf. meneghiniana]
MAPAIETERKRARLLHPSSSPVSKWMTSDSVTSRALAVLQACSSSSSSSVEEDSGGCNNQRTVGPKEGALLKDSLHQSDMGQGEQLSKNSASAFMSQECSVYVDALDRSTQIRTTSNNLQISSHVCGNLNDHRNFEAGEAVYRHSQPTEPLIFMEGEREIINCNKVNLYGGLGSDFTKANEKYSQRSRPTSTNVSMKTQSTQLTKNTEVSAHISKKRQRPGGKNQSTAEHSSRITSVSSSRSPNKNFPSKLARTDLRMAQQDVYFPRIRLTRKTSTSSLEKQQKYLKYDVEDVCPHDLGSKYGDVLSSYLSTPFDSRAMKSLYQSKEFDKDDDTTPKYEGDLKIMSQKKFLKIKKDVLADAVENDLLEQLESSIGLLTSKNGSSR